MDALVSQINNGGEVQHLTFPGAYSVVYLMADGGVICSRCVQSNQRLIMEAHQDQQKGVADRDWLLIGAKIYEEGPTMHCSNCGRDIESEYSA